VNRDLPRDLAKPRRDPEDIRLLANVIVGGVLLLLCVGLLIAAWTTF
jgi:hypothetical protein